VRTNELEYYNVLLKLLKCHLRLSSKRDQFNEETLFLCISFELIDDM
jgi:hypothetical protein